MDFRKWSKSEVEYSRKILTSGLEGARSGREAYLHGRAITPLLEDSARKAWKPALVGACLGMLSSLPGNHDLSIARTLTYGLLGGVIGLSTGMTWESWGLTESAASAALRNIHKVRDEHWVERHPVACA
jgi:hypothetical protein